MCFWRRLAYDERDWLPYSLGIDPVPLVPEHVDDDPTFVHLVSLPADEHIVGGQPEHGVDLIDLGDYESALVCLDEGTVAANIDNGSIVAVAAEKTGFGPWCRRRRRPAARARGAEASAASCAVRHWLYDAGPCPFALMQASSIDCRSPVLSEPRSGDRGPEPSEVSCAVKHRLYDAGPCPFALMQASSIDCRSPVPSDPRSGDRGAVRKADICVDRHWS